MKKFVALFILFALVIFSQTQKNSAIAGANGKLVAIVSAPIFLADTSELAARIQVAEHLKNETIVSENGAGIPHENFWWATRKVYENFENAIDAAQKIIDDIEKINFVGPLSRGDEFQITLRIENNTGFANLATKISVPAGLELTNIALGDAPNLSNGFVAPENFPIVGSQTAIALWGARTNNFSDANADLLTYTFKISADAIAGETAPIFFAFEDFIGDAPPLDINGKPLSISLPETNGEIARVVIN